MSFPHVFSGNLGVLPLDSHLRHVSMTWGLNAYVLLKTWPRFMAPLLNPALANDPLLTEACYLLFLVHLQVAAADRNDRWRY